MYIRQGPGPMGFYYRIHMESVTTYCQADYLLSQTVRHAPNSSIDLHRTTAYMHTRVSAYMHPTKAYFAPNHSIDLHPTSAYLHPKVSI